MSTPATAAACAPSSPPTGVATEANSTAPIAVPIFSSDASPYSPYSPTAYPEAYAENSSADIHIAMVPENVTLLGMTYSLSRSITFLSMLDGFFLCVLSIFNVFWLFFLFGPISGYFGATRFNINLIYIYLFYYCLRIIGDLILAVVGYWWYFFAVVLDLFIFRYVLRYAALLRLMTAEDILLLTDAELVASLRPAGSSSEV
jgi:hypothetical protein